MRSRVPVLVAFAACVSWVTAWAQVAPVASPHGDIAIPCADCHQASGWKPAHISTRFNHARSGFALAGAHASSSCSSCHQSLKFVGVTATCANCHRDNHRGELGANCARCHTSSSFTDRAGMYRAHQQTRFPLDGPHAAVDCQSCHVPAPQGGLTYVNRPTECQACHLPAFKATTNPAHVAAGFPKDCLSCHSRSQWQGGRFDHSTTTFALAGAHLTAQCADCHADGVFKNRPQTCVSCHQKNYDEALNPTHKTSGFPTDCTQCHTGTTEWLGATFDHGATRFALVGAHQAVVCKDCHVGGVWRGTSMECVSCHRPSFDKTVNPNHPAAAFSTGCTSCHNTTAWKGAPYDHSTTQFPLTGAHLAVSCQTCHTDGAYKGKSTLCVSCHQKNYDGSLNPNHKAAAFPTDCASCHKTTVWKGATFNHSATQFPLAGAHLAVTCLDCHADGVYRGKATQCVSCHQKNYDASLNPNHKTAGFPTGCTTCHNTTAWKGATFNHGATQFPLTGAHLAVTCRDCHADGVYKGKSTLCVSCHQKNYDGSLSPNHKAAGFPIECTSCHNTTAWKGATFNHSATQFPLTGVHLAASCQQCHADGVYKGKSTLCASCHQKDYDGALSPNHKASGFPTDCTSCHKTAGWKGATFNHGATQFPLTGAHLAVTCLDCHADGVYKGKSTLCVSCHQKTYDATLSPNHKAAGFPTGCTTCHSTTAWKGAAFNHTATQFPLTGAHLAATCQQCHADGVYKGKSTLCQSCHQKEYDGALNPNHKTAGFPTSCTSCHKTTGWKGASFNHSATLFPLTGAHLAASCLDCHADGVYKGKSTLCLSCHQKAYDGTLSPNHKAAGFPTSCTSCHNTTAWKGATFNHSATLFPLTGAHKAASCLDCHADGVYKGKSTLCASCHQKTYDATLSPNHKAAGFPTTCNTCHSTTAWQGATFNHSATQFPLTGAHLAASCQQCHADGVYKGKSTLCASCHQKTYDATLSPNHKAAGFPTTCNTCHSTTAWQGATFNHSATLFPLTGAHLAASCQDCHADGVYKGKSTLCASCHQKAYDATLSPNHKAAGFPTTCNTCHSTTAWPGATFNHSATQFPLTGAHLAASCQQCHADGVYKGKSTACVSCHLTDFNGTTNPNHKTAKFPTTCTSCHSTTAWAGAKFDHDAPYFPIYSGKHLGRWNTCADCHTNNANYAVFTCLTCHAKAVTDSHHQGRSGYSYTSSACYSCHPRGSAG